MNLFKKQLYCTINTTKKKCIIKLNLENKREKKNLKERKEEKRELLRGLERLNLLEEKSLEKKIIETMIQPPKGELKNNLLSLNISDANGNQ